MNVPCRTSDQRAPVMRGRRRQTQVGLSSPACARTDPNSPANGEAGLAPVPTSPSPYTLASLFTFRPGRWWAI